VLLASTSGVSVAVTHLSVSNQHTRQVPAVLASLAERPAPRLLMGDFNHEWPDLRGYALAGGGPTFPARVAERRIDHIAVDGLHVVSTTVVQLDVSDHRALVATLTTA
jgi:endonuclease/exonuclease/phosphatase family metal-dependent hydrolase